MTGKNIPRRHLRMIRGAAIRPTKGGGTPHQNSRIKGTCSGETKWVAREAICRRQFLAGLPRCGERIPRTAKQVGRGHGSNNRAPIHSRGQGDSPQTADVRDHAAASRVARRPSAVAQPLSTNTGHSLTGMLLRWSHDRIVVIGRPVASAIDAWPTALMMSR